jgi:hypothetical protein
MNMFVRMTWKTYALMSGVTVFSMWFAAGQPSTVPGGVTPAQPRQAAGAAAAVSDIEEQANRLQARLQHEAYYHEPGRNLFRFGSKPAAPRPAPQAAVEPPPAPVVEPPPAAPPPLPMRLAGVATDQNGDVTTRTAVLSTFSGVILARPGDEVLGRFRVTAVEEDAVELVTIPDGMPVRLTLKK